MARFVSNTKNQLCNCEFTMPEGWRLGGGIGQIVEN